LEVDIEKLEIYYFLIVELEFCDIIEATRFIEGVDINIYSSTFYDISLKVLIIISNHQSITIGPYMLLTIIICDCCTCIYFMWKFYSIWLYFLLKLSLTGLPDIWQCYLLLLSLIVLSTITQSIMLSTIILYNYHYNYIYDI